MNVTSKNAKQAGVFWWIGWILLTILSFFACAHFWTGFLAKHYGAMDKPGAPILWVAAVFGSWMVLLVPLIIVMYGKVDKAYEDARIAREKSQELRKKAVLSFRNAPVDKEQRLLTQRVASKLKIARKTIPAGHLVHLFLKNGEKIPYVFVANQNEIVGLYGAETMTFKASDVTDLELVSNKELPSFKTEEWLRVDSDV